MQDMAVSDTDTAQKILDFVDAIEEDEDVSEVHTNADIDDSVIAEM